MAAVLIERSAFLASLEGLLREALDGGGRLVFVGGEAGVGKTTLATALARAAVAGPAGPAVRRGSCDNVTTAEALGPILDALPELAAVVDHADDVSRLRLFRQIREELSASPMLLLLEDVHWADEATLDILRFLGRRLAGTRLMILATFRPEEVGRAHPLTVVMGELAGLALPRGPRPASRANPAGLTARETEVLQLLADGLSYAEVAERLVLSEKTVGHHVSAVLRKLREPTRSRAVARALRLGVIPPR